MKITDVQTFIVGNPWKNWTFIKLHTDSGIYGIGEATAHREAKTVETAVLEYRRYYLGLDPFSIEEVNYELIKAGAPAQVRAAVDIACWDIMGKTLEQPVYNLIGGKFRDRVRAYANGWYQVERKPALFAERACAVVERGYQAMKFDPFGTAFEAISSRELSLSVDIVAAVREEVGPHVDLFIECHGRFDPVLGARIGKLMEPYRPGWFEEPVRSRRIETMAALNAKLTIPVAGGESLAGVHDFQRFMSAKAAQIIQPDPVTCGGISELKKICAIAQSHHIQVAPHNAQGPVCTAACFHVDASTSNILIQEVFEDFATPFAAKITDYPTNIVDGHILIPDRPGLGLDLDEKEMAKYPYDESHFLDMYGKEGGWEKRNLA
ncbi:MAG: mandelate racemase/muconate lactonizing enzyme family protein [Candidatus Latescibacterota bacterium]|nr:mandelate racemase/muconate lactonizing enzyme family protein [Candidatus Latescibacterota bacterium]